jgi:general secretion pathway protein D
LIGDKEAVDLVQTTIQSISKKLLTAGEGTSRAIFHPVNTKPEELIQLINDSLGKTENIKIVQDKRTDRLVLHGAESSLNRVLRLLKELDRPVTKQALIKIRLIEVHSKDLAELGITFPDTLAQTSDIGDFTKAQAIIPATFTGFKENSKAKTLANPTIRCMDKEEATIDISEQIPVKETTTEYLPVASASLAARSSENWTTTDIGIKLGIQPFIHKNNEITMNVDIDLTELVQFVEGHPWTAKRLIKTKVRVKNNETVVIGGLIRNKKDKTKRPVPLLNRIPFLRKLFRPLDHKTNSDESTEMVVLITPSVVGSEGITTPQRSIELVNSKK